MFRYKRVIQQPAQQTVRRAVGILLGALYFLLSPATASYKVSDGPVSVNEARLAARLASLGDRQKDPQMLLVAARIINQHGVRGTALPTQELAGKQSGGMSAKALLDRAQLLAKSNPMLLAMIEDARGESSRGAQRGAWTDRLIASAQKDTRQSLIFKKGEPARYGVDGDGDTDLELEVLDLAGKRVCGAVAPGDQKECSWVPTETAEFMIVIRNRGRTANAFTFWHN